MNCCGFFCCDKAIHPERPRSGVPVRLTMADEIILVRLPEFYTPEGLSRLAF
ncbi:MAG: hypothetical protein JW832_04760 [Deltaproteobacteria bacterium]|nr:hypothetical protein [Deltaproteobacteria bacterium]